MKKIYTLLATVFVAGALSAQTDLIDGGDFEGTYMSGSMLVQQGFPVPNSNNFGVIANIPNISWLGILKQETASPISGSKSLSLTNVLDTIAAEGLWGPGTEPQTGGVAQQMFEGDLLTSDPNKMNFTFKYQYTPAEGDTAFALVQLLDTNNAQSAQVLWQGMWIEYEEVATAQQAALTTWQQVTANNGTINAAVITFGSSLGNFYYDTPAPLGTTFIVDDVSWTYKNVGVEEITNASALVYPNPTSNVLNIEVKNTEASSLNVYGVDGKVVLTSSLTGAQSTVDVSNLNNGVYFYNISTIDGNVMNGTFIKE